MISGELVCTLRGTMSSCETLSAPPTRYISTRVPTSALHKQVCSFGKSNLRPTNKKLTGVILHGLLQFPVPSNPRSSRQCSPLTANATCAHCPSSECGTWLPTAPLLQQRLFSSSASPIFLPHYPQADGVQVTSRSANAGAGPVMAAASGHWRPSRHLNGLCRLTEARSSRWSRLDAWDPRKPNP